MFPGTYRLSPHLDEPFTVNGFSAVVTVQVCCLDPIVQY